MVTHFHASSFVETFLVLLFATSWCHQYIIVDSIADMLMHVLCRHIITEQHGIQHSTREYEAKQIIIHKKKQSTDVFNCQECKVEAGIVDATVDRTREAAS